MAVIKRMTKSPRMTNAQRRDAYREAVRATLVRFYDTPDLSAPGWTSGCTV
jgi:hypothetical protein